MNQILYLKILTQILIVLEKIFLTKLAKDEKKVNYNNLFFYIDDKSLVKSADFLKEFGTFYDLLIYLLDNSMKIVTSSEDQIKFFKAIIVLSIKTDITDQSQEQKKKLFAEQENVLSNAAMLLTKRGDLIDQFSKNSIISRDEKYYDDPKKGEESILEKLEQNSDQSISKWVQVSKDRFVFINLNINKNKKLSTMIDKKKLYTK